MDQTFLIFLLMILLNSCYSKSLKRKHYRSVTKIPAVRFSLDGHNFQLGILTLPGIVQEDIVEDMESTTEVEAETITQFAMLKVVPELITPVEAKPKYSGKFDKTVKTLNKMKDLYNELGNLLKDHETELLSLLKDQDSSKESIEDDTPSGDTSVQVKINDDSSRDNNVPEKSAYSGHFNAGTRKDEDENSLNIHLHAEPPLKMRTFIGYPQKSQENSKYPMQNFARIRIYPRQTPPSTVLDPPYELSTQESLEQGLANDEETFLRRGSELLLSMWKRFQSRKTQRKLEEQQPDNFNEDVDDAKLSKYSYYPFE